MTKELTLPSGQIAVLRNGKGKDLLQAQMKAKTPEEIPYALIAELAEINGQKFVYEDILEMDLSDVFALQSEITGKFQIAPQNETSKKETQEAKVQQTEIVVPATSPTAKV
nr:MAG TPA: hypothetical protein [Caudoviricetes sp.]